MDIENNTALEEMIIQIPIWEESVWTALQNKKFLDAALNLQDTLEYFTNDGLRLIFWKGIIEGAPAIRGVVSEDEWRDSFLPLVAAVFVNFADGESAGRVFERTEKSISKYFFGLISDSIPGESGIEKISKLKTFASSLYIYFLSSPSQIINNDLLESPSVISEKKDKDPFYQLGFLSADLKKIFFSFDTANIIYNLCSGKKFGDDVVSGIGHTVGAVILGIISIDNLPETIQTVSKLDSNDAEFFAKSIKDSILSKHLQEIKEIFEGTKKPVTTPNEGISLEIFGQPAPTSPSRVSIKQDAGNISADSAPLILHTEKQTAPNIRDKQTPSKGFPQSFWFSKKASKKQTINPTKATIEFPTVQKKDKAVHYSELRTPIAPFQKDVLFVDNQARPNAPIKDVATDKKDAREININHEIITNKNKDREKINNAMASISQFIAERQQPTEVKKGNQPLKKTTEQKNDPNLAGTGFFFPFKKGVEKNKITEEKSAPLGPETDGNTINLRN